MASAHGLSGPSGSTPATTTNEQQRDGTSRQQVEAGRRIMLPAAAQPALQERPSNCCHMLVTLSLAATGITHSMCCNDDIRQRCSGLMRT